jgi:hypothetical protein
MAVASQVVFTAHHEAVYALGLKTRGLYFG